MGKGSLGREKAWGETPECEKYWLVLEVFKEEISQDLNGCRYRPGDAREQGDEDNSEISYLNSWENGAAQGEPVD